ncbi:hypothetical protein F5887DRAFT_915922 [Amanita rubescens]|nr:hypothetical protein F5887DRAFT_915922 [Amanita rubescens]
MPIQAESQNTRLVSQLGASRSSYNTKDPPESCLRKDPGSWEAPLSFSKYIEHFYPKALTDYQRERETLKRELSIFHASHPRIMDMAWHEPNPIEQRCVLLQSIYANIADHDRLVAFYEGELSSLERELYARYEQKYSDFRCKELLEIEREAKRTRNRSSMRLSVGSTPLKPKRIPVKSVSETASTDAISRHQPRLSVCVKPLERLNTVVLSRESPKGSSLMGVEPSNGVVLNPAFPKHAKACAIMKAPATRRKEVSQARETMSAAKYSPTPKAALTLLKPTPVSSIRASPAPSSKDGTSRSSGVISMRHTSNAVNTRREVNKTSHQKKETPSRVSLGPSSTRAGNMPSLAVSDRQVETHSRISSKAATQPFSNIPSDGIIEHSNECSNARPGLTIEQAPVNLFSTEVEERRREPVIVFSIQNEEQEDAHSPASKAAPTLLKSLPIFSIRTPPAPASKDGVISSLRVTSTRRTSNIINMRRVMSVDTHREAETLTRVSLKTVAWRFGKMPSAGDIERSDEHSNVAIGPVNRQALASLSTKVEERRREPNAVVSIQKEEKEDVQHSPNTPGVFALQAPAPSTPSVMPSSALLPFLPLDDPIPPVPRRRDLNVGNKKRLASANTRQANEARTRASVKMVALQFGEPPPTGGLERSKERSNATTRPALKQASTLSSSPKVGEKRRAPETIVNKIKESNEMPVVNVPPLLQKSVPAPSIPACHAHPHVDGVSPSSPEFLTPETSCISNSGRLASAATHREKKAPTRVSNETDIPRSGEPPSTHALERLLKCPNFSEGPSDERALIAPPPGVMAEERQALSSISGIQHDSEVSSSPSASASPALHVFAPTTLSVLPTHAIPPQRPSDTLMPPVEVISRRLDRNVVNMNLVASIARLPSLETALERSNPFVFPSSIGGEGQLTRAAAYIRERRDRRFSAFDEFPRRSPKEPPDKLLECASIRDEMRHLELVDVVGKEMKASVAHAPPVRHPESPKLSHSLSEEGPELLASAFTAPVVDSPEMKPRQSKRAIEATRCSDERLRTIEVSGEPVWPALMEIWGCSSRENLGWESDAIQDGVVCLAVLQEASVADNAAGALRQSKNAIAPLREPSLVSNDTMSVRSHSPASSVNPLLPMLSSARSPHAPSPHQPDLASGDMLRYSDDGDLERCLHDVVSGGGTVNAGSYTHEYTTESSLLSHPQFEPASSQPPVKPAINC